MNLIYVIALAFFFYFLIIKVVKVIITLIFVGIKTRYVAPEELSIICITNASGKGALAR